ncbi:MAG TPA: haloacid dehalogenase type II [Thermoanaerobaculia bacterium]|nr:haloacid dehalogenase type II [Thermoanaerobaculia bacterium]
MIRYDVVAFDLYGTLLDISGLAARMQPLVGSGSAALLARWRKNQLERTWRLNHEGRYDRWDHVTAAALSEVAPELSPTVRHNLAEMWLELPAYPDAAASLRALKEAGVKRAILSNGTRAMITRALEVNMLTVDKVLSADDVHVYKTNPRVYALLDSLAARSRTLFITANGWDSDGARRDSRITGWIDRGGGEPPQIPPSFRISSLSEVPALLK